MASSTEPASDLFRGEIMRLCQIYFQSEVAYSCVSQLGEMGVVQFNDVSKLLFETLNIISHISINFQVKSDCERVSTPICKRCKAVRRNGKKNK